MKRHRGLGLLSVFAIGFAACTPGYMKASDLESKHQGPSDCEARCVELGMRMGALVLVSNEMPGCVCQPKPPVSDPAPPGGDAPKSDAAQQGASAATTGYVVAALAAAAAARAQQQRQQEQQQRSYVAK